MTPTEAGFDGKNLTTIMDLVSYRLSLSNGKIWPDTEIRERFKNQLMWYYPEGEEPRLLFCNNENKIFELSFTEVTK